MAQVIHAHEEHGIHWRAAIWAGIIAGAVFLVMEMLLVATVGGGSAWGPPRMMAAIILGQGVLPPPATFSFGIMLAALIVHFSLSVVYGLAFGWIARPFSTGTATLAGAIFGLVLYLVNFYGIAPVFFPWFEMAQNWITVLSHIVFGMVLGGGCKMLEHHREV